MASANHLLGEFTLSNIARAKAGVPNVVVSFKVDQNGILHCSAKDQGSGSTASVTIENDADRLTKSQIEAMISDAKKFEAEDRDTAKAMEAKGKLKDWVEAKKKQDISKLSLKDRRKVDKALSTAEEFYRSFEGKSATDFMAKLREAESVTNPILDQLYDGGDGRDPDADDDDGDQTRSDEL